MAAASESLSGRRGGGRLNVENPGARPAMGARRDSAARRLLRGLWLIPAALLLLVPETANRLDA